MVKGQPFQLKEPYTHSNGRTYTRGWVHEVKMAQRVVQLLLEPACTDPALSLLISWNSGETPSSVNVIVEFPVDYIGEQLPFEYGAVYATA